MHSTYPPAKSKDLKTGITSTIAFTAVMVRVTAIIIVIILLAFSIRVTAVICVEHRLGFFIILCF